MRLLTVVSLVLLGVLGPLLTLVVGLLDRKPVLLALGGLGLLLSLGLGWMLAAGQTRLRRTLGDLASKMGMGISEQPDLIPGLAQLSLNGEWRGQRVAVGFENLPAAGTGEFPAGERLYKARSRQFLVASLWAPAPPAALRAGWLDLPAAGLRSPLNLELDATALARLQDLGVRKVQLGGSRWALAWDGKVQPKDLDAVLQGLAWLAARAQRETGVIKEERAACPVCGAVGRLDPRYPRAVCPVCVRRACDKNGRALDFFNQDAGGGYLAQYRDNGETYRSHDCYIEGRRCRADEAKFGGIVVQLNERPDACG